VRDLRPCARDPGGIAARKMGRDGELEGDDHVLAGRLELNFSPDLGWSNLVQYDSDSREPGFQSRLRWRIRPGSDLFVVFDRGWVHEEDGAFHPYFDRGSAKVQHTFRW